MRRPRGPAGLRTRLILAVGLVVVITVAVAFAVVYHQTAAQLSSQLDTSLRQEAHELAQAMDADADETPADVLAQARRYARSQSYENAAVLLFAVVPGYGTASNHPELVTENPQDGDETAAEQAVENAEAVHLAAPHPGFYTAPGPDVGLLRIYQERLTIAGGRAVYAAAAESLSGIDRAQRGVARSFVLAGALAMVVALALAYLIGTRVAAPLRDASALAARVDGGELTPRLSPPPGASRELHVLADGFNHMLDRLTVAFQAQRDFVADASHELRTPLTVMRGQLDLLMDAGREPSGVEPEAVTPAELQRVGRLLLAEISRITRLTDDLLLLAESEQSDFLHLDTVELVPFITDLWDGLSLTAERRFEVGPIPELSIRADPDRLAQALRNLGANAINHTDPPTGVVRIEAHLQTGSGLLRIEVSDDGPGIPPSQRARVFERFFRTDAARSRARGGAGLGLAIVQAIVTAHGGSIRVTDGPRGGARFEIDLPVRAGRT